MSVQAVTALLAVALVSWAGVAQGAEKPRQQALKEKLIEMPAGSVVEARLLGKESVRGKLGNLSDAGFEIQTVRDGRIETRTIAYDEVRSVKLHQKGMSTTARIVLGTLAGVGVVFVILIAVAASRGWY